MYGFRPDFFHAECRPPRTFSPVMFGGRVAGRWSIPQKPELISAARRSVLHCQRPGNATLKRRDPPVRFFRCSLLSLHLSISDHKTSSNSSFFCWPLPKPRNGIATRMDARSYTLSVILNQITRKSPVTSHFTCRIL